MMKHEDLKPALALSKRDRWKAARARPREKKKLRSRAQPDPISPTPERMAKDRFVQSAVVNHEEASRSYAYQLVSWHTTQRERGGLDDEQVKIIVKYIDQWQILDSSPLKSNLNREISDGKYNPFRHLEAQKKINHWNACMGRVEANEFVLVCCKGLGYNGAARAIWGDTATRSDARRIKRNFFKSLEILDAQMK